ncbi:MAG: hypothetical protein H6806_08920 [Planctomycetes bacterium]|nr:hypothetical protein [Planctomycetota bacterium]
MRNVIALAQVLLQDPDIPCRSDEPTNHLTWTRSPVRSASSRSTRAAVIVSHDCHPKLDASVWIWEIELQRLHVVDSRVRRLAAAEGRGPRKQGALSGRRSSTIVRLEFQARRLDGHGQRSDDSSQAQRSAKKS